MTPMITSLASINLPLQWEPTGSPHWAPASVGSRGLDVLETRGQTSDMHRATGDPMASRHALNRPEHPTS